MVISKKIVLLLVLGILLIVIGFLSQQSSKQSLNTPSIILQPTRDLENNNLETVKVIKVIDGDTIEIANGQKVRYIGINAPETVDLRKPVQCFGKEASLKNKELVEGKTVKLEKDVSEVDKYNRLLRYVYSDNLLVNDYLIRRGYAYADSFPPDIKYQDQFIQAQKEARENKRGLWSNCK